MFTVHILEGDTSSAQSNMDAGLREQEPDMLAATPRFSSSLSRSPLKCSRHWPSARYLSLVATLKVKSGSAAAAATEQHRQVEAAAAAAEQSQSRLCPAHDALTPQLALRLVIDLECRLTTPFHHHDHHDHHHQYQAHSPISAEEDERDEFVSVRATFSAGNRGKEAAAKSFAEIGATLRLISEEFEASRRSQRRTQRTAPWYCVLLEVLHNLLLGFAAPVNRLR